LASSLSSVTATAAVLTMTLPAVAGSIRIPPDARGYQTTMIVQEAAQQHSAAPAPANPPTQSSWRPAPSISVDVNVPNVAPPPPGPPTYVTIRGPHGEVRRFALAKGVEVQYVQRNIVLRPGE